MKTAIQKIKELELKIDELEIKAEDAETEAEAIKCYNAIRKLEADKKKLENEAENKVEVKDTEKVKKIMKAIQDQKKRLEDLRSEQAILEKKYEEAETGEEAAEACNDLIKVEAEMLIYENPLKAIEKLLEYDKEALIEMLFNAEANKY